MINIPLTLRAVHSKVRRILLDYPQLSYFIASRLLVNHFSGPLSGAFTELYTIISMFITAYRSIRDYVSQYSNMIGISPINSCIELDFLRNPLVLLSISAQIV